MPARLAKVRKVKPDLIPHRGDRNRVCFDLSGRDLPSYGELVSLGDRYIVSLSALVPATTLILDPGGHPHPLDVKRLMVSCATLSFALDTLVTPSPSNWQRGSSIPRPHRPWGTTTSKAHPIQMGGFDVFAYFRSLEEAAEALTFDTQALLSGRLSGVRKIRHKYLDADEWWYIPWPETDDLARALTSYWTGLCAPTLSGRILGFWRACEALSPTPRQKRELLESAPRGRIDPVWEDVRTLQRSYLTNWAPRLRRKALARLERLTATHGTIEDVGRWLLRGRRGAAAHADDESLDLEGLADLPDIFEDLLLIQYLARLSIETRWKAQ